MAEYHGSSMPNTATEDSIQVQLHHAGWAGGPAC
jgi:hypothetical protein